MKTKIKSVLKTIWGIVVSCLRALFKFVASIPGFVASVPGFVVSIPGRVISVLKTIWGTLVSCLRAFLKFVVSTIVKFTLYLKKNWVKLLSYFLAFLTVVAFITFVVMSQTEAFSLAAFRPYRSLIIKGVRNTIYYSLIALLGSMILGFLLYLFSKSNIKYLYALQDIFTEIIYGTPLLVLVIITTFLISPAFVSETNRMFTGAMALIVYMGPYMKNVYKSAFSSISEEQYMAMDLFGFTAFQRYRYIIIPQVLRILMPPLMNNFTFIIKGSALLNVLSLTEIFYAVRVAQSKTFEFTEGYVLMWVLYLVITIPLSQITKYIERKWSL